MIPNYLSRAERAALLLLSVSPDGAELDQKTARLLVHRQLVQPSGARWTYTEAGRRVAGATGARRTRGAR